MPNGPMGITLSGYKPGGLGKVVELHGRYYGAEWNFDLAFEADIATDLAAFLGRLDPARDGFWLAWLERRSARSRSTAMAKPMRRICAGSSPNPASPARVSARR